MNVFFATPAYRGINCIPFIDSLSETVTLCESKGWKTSFSIQTGNCYVQMARNELVREFLKTDATHLFFLDDDISWPAQAVIDFVDSGLDVIAGAYPKRCEELDFPVVVYTHSFDNTPLVNGNLLLAKGVPTGFLCIRRRVIEELIKTYPEQKYTDFDLDKQPFEHYDLFPQGVRDGRWYGEDFAFCELWVKAGGLIWLQPNITFSHYDGEKQYVGNYHEFLLQQPGGSNFRKES